MPRSTREWALRELINAKGNIDWAISHIGQVADRYEKLHPEIAEPLYSVAAVLLAAEEALTEARKGL